METQNEIVIHPQEQLEQRLELPDEEDQGQQRDEDVTIVTDGFAGI